MGMPAAQYARENKEFRYWRIRTMYSIMIGYAAFYLVRQNFSIAVPSICSELQISKTDIGWVMSIGGLLYGVGKFAFGLVGDKYSARYVMPIGLAVSGLMNICLGMSSAIPLIVICYALNQCFQSMGNPPCMKLLANWHGATELGGKWAIWNMSVHAGNSLAMWLAPVLLLNYGWRAVFYIPGVCAILLSGFLFDRLRDTPESMGFPSIEEIEGTEKKKKTNAKLSFKELCKLVLTNKYVWCVAMANFFVYINRMTFLNWGPTLLQESRGSSLGGAGFQMILFDIAGILGGIVAGYASDKLFKGRRAPVGAIIMFLMCGIMGIFRSIPKDSFLLSSICILVIGALMTCPIILISMAATDFTSKKAAASATGFTGTLGYVGTAVSGVGCGWLAEHYGWNAVVVSTMISALLGAVLFVMLWNKKPNEAQEGNN